MDGLVIKSQSGFFTVITEDGAEIVSQIAGRLKQHRRKTSLVAIGDHVTISILDDGTGLIESVAERTSTLSRTRPVRSIRSKAEDREQILIANPDQVVFVFSIASPMPSLRKLDRFLVVAELNDLPAIVCVNKIDLTGIEPAREQFQLYEDIGYQILYTSVVDSVGIDDLLSALKDKISIFAGSSGVGKSSLLNKLQPGLGLTVKEVSTATTKGLHTTRHSELIPLEVGGYVADTPGIRGLALFDVEPTEIDGYFREIAPLIQDCQFADCSHRHEPGCAVRAAAENGSISAARYDSYLRLREEHEHLEDAMY